MFNVLWLFFAELGFWEIIGVFILTVMFVSMIFSEKGLLGILPVIVFLFYPFGESSLYSYIGWFWSLVGIIPYVILGILWSRWKLKRAHKEALEDYSFQSRSHYDFDDEDEDSQSSELEKTEHLKNYLRSVNKRSPFSYWILGWPFSVFGYFFKDFLYDVAKSVYKRLATMYRGMSDKAAVDYLKQQKK